MLPHFYLTRKSFLLLFQFLFVCLFGLARKHRYVIHVLFVLENYFYVTESAIQDVMKP